MADLYTMLKQLANFAPLPCAVLAVEKNDDGTCGDIKFFVINDVFKRNYYDLFMENEAEEKISFEDFDEVIEGKSYTEHLPKESKFEEVCFRAAWLGKPVHTYVDTTKMYGYWTEDILLPIACPHDDKVAYCQFMYSLNKEMDTGKYATVAPDISSFVIKSCLELQNEKDFFTSLDTVIGDLREYSDASDACVMMVDHDARKFEVISESVRNNIHSIKEYFSTFPYEIVAGWADLLKGTDGIIINNSHDMDELGKRAPAWVKTMVDADVENLCLYPLIHRGEIIGYLYITNCNAKHIARLKEVVNILAFFLTAHVANHLIMEKLEYLSNVDTLTDVYNRNCMNINVDELSLKLKLEPKPFAVAFFDLNGLKTINDNGGHTAGDNLLKDAANVLKGVFKEDKIYRAGGDEFVVISVECTEEEFAAKIEKVREQASDPDWLYFAIGYYHDAKKGKLRLAMRYADEKMYEDKNAFYNKYPEKRR